MLKRNVQKEECLLSFGLSFPKYFSGISGGDDVLKLILQMEELIFLQLTFLENTSSWAAP